MITKKMRLERACIYRRLGCLSLILFVITVSLVISCNVYLLSIHTEMLDNSIIVADATFKISRDPKPHNHHYIELPRRHEQLTSRWKHLSNNWTSVNQPDDVSLAIKFRIIEQDYDSAINMDLTVNPWSLGESWLEPRQIYPKEPIGLMSILRALSKQPVTKAEVFKKAGTQLKLVLLLKGGQRVMMKPMRSSREDVFLDTPYSGADRHTSEIAAFHLSRLLDLRWCPLVSGRVVDLNREIKPVASNLLLKTFFNQGNDTCFHGVCHYCSRKNPVCAPKGILETAFILWLPLRYKLKVHRHPWARTYKAGKKAIWEKNDSYCQRVKQVPPYNEEQRLLDLVDVAIFDFLTGNADRHRYETIEMFINSSVILLDNGKSFGNPFDDELSILAPLYQCCIVRLTTMETLKRYPGRALSSALESLLKMDPLYPVLTEAHLYALDRRRYKVLDTIAWCLEKQADVFRT